MGFRFLKRINANTGLFNGYFIDVKTFYVLRFNAIPCVTFIGDVDLAAAFAHVNGTLKAIAAYQYSFFDHDQKEMRFNNTIIVLEKKRMIELADNYCQLLYTAGDYDFAGMLASELAKFRIEGNKGAFRHTHVVGFAKSAEMN